MPAGSTSGCWRPWRRTVRPARRVRGFGGPDRGPGGRRLSGMSWRASRSRSRSRLTVGRASPCHPRGTRGRGWRESRSARLADHAETAGDHEGVLRWAPDAAEQAARGGSHREAAAQLARALRFGDGLPLDRRAELLQRRVDECWMTDQFDAAIEAQEEALDCWRRLGDRLGEGDALRTLSRLMFFVGRVQEGERWRWRRSSCSSDCLQGTSWRWRTATSRSAAWRSRTSIEQSHAGTRALELARRLDDTEALAYSLTNIGAAELQAGLEEGRVKQERGARARPEHGLEDYAGGLS